MRHEHHFANPGIWAACSERQSHAVTVRTDRASERWWVYLGSFMRTTKLCVPHKLMATFVPPSAANPSGCLMAVSVKRPRLGYVAAVAAELPVSLGKT
jgi:hypothetical protein